MLRALRAFKFKIFYNSLRINFFYNFYKRQSSFFHKFLNSIPFFIKKVFFNVFILKLLGIFSEKFQALTSLFFFKNFLFDIISLASYSNIV